MQINLLPKVYDLVSATNYSIFVLYGGRDSGKSYGIAEYLVGEAHLTEQKILCVREYTASIKDSNYTLIKDTIQRLNLPNWEFTLSSIRRIDKDGNVLSEFLFKGIKINPKSIKSIPGLTRVWVEEAEDVSEDSWITLLPTLRANDPKNPPKMYITFNPHYETDPTYQRWVINPPPYAKVVQMNYYDNRHISDFSKMQIQHMKSSDYDLYLYLHVYEGECKRINNSKVFSGRYIVQEFETPEDADFFHGIDWGFSSDPTAMIRCFIEGNKLFIDREVYRHGVEIPDLPRFINEMPNSKKIIIRGDNSRPEIISYLKNQGYAIKAARKWAGSIEDGISYLRSFDQIVIHPRCSNTINEFKLYSYKIRRDTNEILPELVDKHNHLADGLRYALEPLIKPQKEASFKVIGV